MPMLSDPRPASASSPSSDAAATAPPPLAMNQFTTQPQSFEQDLTLYQSLGVPAVELCEAKLDEDPAKAREQVDRLRGAGLRLTSIQPTVHGLFPERMAPQPTDPEDRLARFRRTLGFMADALPEPHDIPLVLIGGAAPGHDYRAAWDAARRLLPPLCDEAADRGFRIALEPIHPALMNVDTFIYALDQTLALIDAVDRDNFGFVCDTWHLWPEFDIASRLERVAGRVFIVHLSDWPEGGPRALDDRVIPGQGRIDLAGFLRALRRGGYRGDYALEILSAHKLADSLWEHDPSAVIEASRAGYERAWHQSLAG